jgi:hypothetical protein
MGKWSHWTGESTCDYRWKWEKMTSDELSCLVGVVEVCFGGLDTLHGSGTRHVACTNLS